jgi:hypothetical protein
MKEKLLHNVTLMIKTASDNGLDISSLMKNIDFHEKTSYVAGFQLSPSSDKTYNSYEESLACNMVHNLPFEMYKNHVGANWIEHDVDDDKASVVRTAINQKEYALVSLLLDKAGEYRKNNIKDSEFARKYERNLLRPILNLNTNLANLNSEEVDLKQYVDYLVLFKKALNQFKTHYDERGIAFASSIKLDEFDIHNWFENYSQVTSFLYINSHHDSMQHILQRKEAYPFFNEIFLMQADKIDNPYLNEGFYQNAMSKGNEAVLQHLDAWINPSAEYIEKCFEKAMQEWIEKYHESIGKTVFYDDGKDHYHIRLEKMLEVFEKRVPHYFMKNEAPDLLQYYAGIKYEEFDQVRARYVKEDTALLHGLNTRQWNYIQKCIEEFEQNYNVKKSKMTIDFQYAQTINQKFSQIENPHAHEYNECHDFMKNHMLKCFDSEQGDMYRNKAFGALLLDKSLPQIEDVNTSSHIKMKI